MTTPLVVAVMGVGGVAASYVVVGVLHDAAVRHRERSFERACGPLVDAVLGSEDAAALAIPTLRRLPRRALAQALVGLATDLGGDALPRLRRVSEATGVGRRIRRLAQGRWRRRASAAQLQMLLPDDDPLRTALVLDPHPVVRARAVEALGPEEALDASRRLFDLLGDDNPGVRLAAQLALLRCDARLVPHLIDHLAGEDSTGTLLGLEVAANLPDPRLGVVLLRHADDPDPNRRMLVATALGSTLSQTDEALAVLSELLDDPDSTVRANAAGAIGRLAALELAPRLAAKLSDPAWVVRREAGTSLARMAPVGTMLLRVHLADVDRFARDMARQILDIVTTRDGTGTLADGMILSTVDEMPDEERWAS